MKKPIKSLIILAVLLFMQGFVMAQSESDRAKALQKCIDLPELLQYYPLDAAGNPAQIFVIQYPVSFPEELEVSKFGKDVAFLSRSAMVEKEPEAYFMFRGFEITQNSAKANLNYFYDQDYTTNQYKMVSVIIELKKVESDWMVQQFNMKGDTK